MNLKQYLQSEGLTQAAFAKRVNLPQATVNRYVSGARFPDRKNIMLIEAATNGAVKPADWYEEVAA